MSIYKLKETTVPKNTSVQEREMKTEALRTALVEGEQSGASTPFDFDELSKGKRQKNKRGEKAAT